MRLSAKKINNKVIGYGFIVIAITYLVFGFLLFDYFDPIITIVELSLGLIFINLRLEFQAQIVLWDISIFFEKCEKKTWQTSGFARRALKIFLRRGL